MNPNDSLASLLSGIFSGGVGLAQLFGHGGSSASGSAAAGAAAASPFQSQFSQYQGQVPGALNLSSIIANSLMGGASNASSGLQGLASSGIPWIINNVSGLNTSVPGVPSSVSNAPANLAASVNNLTSNIMSTPGVQFQYQQGLDSLNKSLAASGQLGSGAQMIAAEQYGQNFASTAYQQQLSDLLATQGQEFQQGVTGTQLGASLAGQEFQQGISKNSLLGNLAGMQGNIMSQAAGLPLQYLSAAGNINQGLLNSLGLFSGASTGSPATAGSILSGQFANSQTALGNVAGGVGGALQGLLGSSSGGAGGLLSSAGSWLSSLFGGGDTSSLVGSLGGLGGSFGSASTSAAGYLNDLLSGTGTDFTSYLSDIGSSGVLSDLGAGLGGIF